MKIHFPCPGCGKVFAVDPVHAGKSGKCKACGTAFRVPRPRLSSSESSSGLQAGNLSLSEALDSLEDNAPASPAANATGLEAAPAGFEDHAVGFSPSNYRASNPAGLPFHPWRYVRAYPKWFFIWHTLLAGSVAGTWFWWYLFPLPLLIGWLTAMYWREAAKLFRGGCVAAGKVLSLKPPLVATLVDMRKQGEPVEVVHIGPAPLRRLATGCPEPDQPLVMVAAFFNRFMRGPHWSQCDPSPAAVISGNREKLQQLHDSIDPEDWDLLDQALARIPQPWQPGHYRVYREQRWTHSPQLDVQQIHWAVQNYVATTRQVRLPHQLAPEEQMALRSFLGPVSDTDLLAVLPSKQDASASQALVFASSGLGYCFAETGHGFIPWEQLLGALATIDGLELTLRNGQRLRIPLHHFEIESMDYLDLCIDTILGYTAESPAR